MKTITVDKCNNCPFFNDFEYLDHGIYSTDRFKIFCTANDTDEIFDNKDIWYSSKEILVLEPPTNCPIKEGIIVKTI